MSCMIERAVGDDDAPAVAVATRVPVHQVTAGQAPQNRRAARPAARRRWAARSRRPPAPNLDAQRIGHGVGHRALQRDPRRRGDLDRPALEHAQRRGRARACPARLSSMARGGQGEQAAATGSRPHHRAAGQVPDAPPAAARISDTRSTYWQAAVQRARQDGGVRLVEAEALPARRRAHQQRLQRLGRRAQEGLSSWSPSATRQTKRCSLSTRPPRSTTIRPRLKRRPWAPRARRRRRPRRCRRCSHRRPAAPRRARRPRRCAPRRRW